MKLMLEHEVEQPNATGFYSYTHRGGDIFSHTPSFRIFMLYFIQKFPYHSRPHRKTEWNVYECDTNYATYTRMFPYTYYIYSLISKMLESF